ncbi:MAG: radical SAM protein [Nitrospinae bacterium CG11_big_fil_rev_8_21_14_0_20_56_8]|nr:MAG: radical SAM protein [Nitrospinae bacterium CG11_big_fil_rev_8_21_14_0_20_56_8]
MNFVPQAIYIESGAESAPLTGEVLRRFPEVPVFRNRSLENLLADVSRTSDDVFGECKSRLVLSRFPGSFLKKCPGISPGMVCCNYYVVNLLKNCIYDCSYCFLQEYLQNNPFLVAFVNIEDLLGELEAEFSAYPGRVFRVGTGELTDSLALDTVVPYSRTLLPFFNRQQNAVLELKTKSDRVENLLAHPDPSNVIVSWSINPPQIVAEEEKGTPSLTARLNAARLCRDHGYRIGFHLDPILLFPGWEEAYRELIRELFREMAPGDIEWISLGSFRYRAPLKQIIKERHPGSRLFTGEHVPSKDGKFRYLRPLRNRAYDTIRRYLREVSPNLNIYLCMETREIWEGVTGKLPRSDERLDAFFDL